MIERPSGYAPHSSYHMAGCFQLLSEFRVKTIQHPAAASRSAHLGWTLNITVCRRMWRHVAVCDCTLRCLQLKLRRNSAITLAACNYSRSIHRLQKRSIEGSHLFSSRLRLVTSDLCVSENRRSPSLSVVARCFNWSMVAWWRTRVAI